MPGKITYIPEAAHECEGMPPAEDHEPATIWQCSECGRKWVVVHGAQYNESYQAWRKLTPRNMKGYDR